ncbi:YqeB family protein [Promicromonospora sukumoe]
MTTTQVRQHPALPTVLGLGVLALGLVLGWFAAPIAGWLAGLVDATPLPVPRLPTLIESLSLPWTLGILGGLGLVGGAFIAFMTVGEAPVLTVADDHVEHQQEEREVWVERSDVGAAFRDKEDLVLLGPDGGLRARLDTDTLSAEKVQEALTRHGWPWHDADPHEQRFERWVDGRPGFTAAEHEVLRRRLEERKDAAARRQADADLAALGLVARVRDDRVQVRRTAATEDARGADR